MTEESLRELMRQFDSECDSQIAGKTTLASETIRAKKSIGPGVELPLRVRDVGSHCPHDSRPLHLHRGTWLILRGWFAGTDTRSWFDKKLGLPAPGIEVYAFFDAAAHKELLTSLTPGQSVTVAGSVTGGALAYGRVLPLFLSDSRIVRKAPP